MEAQGRPQDDLRLRLLQEDVSPSDQDAAPTSLSRREKAATRFWRSLAKYFQEHGYRPAASALGSVDRRLTVSGTTGPAAYATPSRRALKANASDPTDYLHAAGSSGEVPFPTHAVAPGQFRRHFLGDQDFQGAEISCHAQLVEFVLDVSFDIQEHYWRMAQAEVELFNAPASSEPESSGVASPVTPSRSRRQSSDLATVLVILKSFLGGTLLVAPGEFLQAGLVSGNLLFCFMGLLELWCMRKLLAAYRQVGGGSFGLLALRALGRGGALAVEVSIVASQLGFIATEMIYFAKNGAHATKWLFEEYLPQESIHKDDVIAWLTWGQLLLVVPVAWHRDLASLTAFNFVGNTLVLSTTIFLAVLAAGGLVSSGVAEDLPFLCPVPRGLVFLGFSVFTFEGINMVIPMYESHRDKASFDRILSRTLVAVIAIFATFSTGNVLLYGDGLRPILTLNLAQDSLASTWVPVAFAIASLALVPLLALPTFDLLESGLARPSCTASLVSSHLRVNIFRAMLLAVCAALARYGGRHLDEFLSLVGAVACVPLALIYPAAIHLRLVASNEGNRLEALGDYFCIVFGIAVTVLCTVEVFHPLS